MLLLEDVLIEQSVHPSSEMYICVHGRMVTLRSEEEQTNVKSKMKWLQDCLQPEI